MQTSSSQQSVRCTSYLASNPRQNQRNQRARQRPARHLRELCTEVQTDRDHLARRGILSGRSRLCERLYAVQGSRLQSSGPRFDHVSVRARSKVPDHKVFLQMWGRRCLHEVGDSRVNPKLDVEGVLGDENVAVLIERIRPFRSPRRGSRHDRDVSRRRGECLL